MTNEFDENAAHWDQEQYRIERAQTIARILESKIPPMKAMDVMDFGCGTGLFGFSLIEKCQSVTFADTSQGMLDQVAIKIRNSSIANARILNLESGNREQKYDLIVSLMVLHHIEDYEGEIVKLIHSLNPGGYLCLCDLDSEDGSFHGEKKVPHNGFRREDILNLYRAGGLDILESQTAYVNKRYVGHREMEFPVFMLLGRSHG